MIKAQIIADSVAPSGVRLTTFILEYPRFIHSEFMTHRMFSRNASSSRAQPVKKKLQQVMTEMAMPIHWGENQKGMQAERETTGWKLRLGKALWKLAGWTACGYAYLMDKLGLHKQVVNRLIEPFSHITVIVTATDWDNFFALRYHPAAQPEIHELAKQMYEAYQVNVPRKLQGGEWHLPFVTDLEREMEAIEPRPGVPALIRKSVARCARVSYKNHDGTGTTLAQDTALYERLLGANPIHASPAEHQAMAVADPDFVCGNFRGWLQYRKTLAGENITKFNKLSEQSYL